MKHSINALISADTLYRVNGLYKKSSKESFSILIEELLVLGLQEYSRAD